MVICLLVVSVPMITSRLYTPGLFVPSFSCSPSGLPAGMCKYRFGVVFVCSACEIMFPCVSVILNLVGPWYWLLKSTSIPAPSRFSGP